MFAPGQESPEMKYIKQQIGRYERELKMWEQKMAFEVKEHQTRLEQKERVTHERMKTLEGNLQKQLASYHWSDQAFESKKRQVQQRLTQLTEAEERARQEFARKLHLKGTETPKDQKSDRLEGLSSDPDMRRITADKERTTRELQTLTKSKDTQHAKDERDYEALKRRLQNDIDRQKQAYEREQMSLDDSGKRTMKGYTDRIERLKYTIDSLKANYEREKREFEIKERQRQKKESEQRAKFGNKSAGQNFATPTDDAPLTSPDRDQDNSTNSRRLGGARW